jgi:hypothetical protein
MSLINTQLIKIIRPQVCISTYLDRTFYHPQIIYNKKQNMIIKYINMDDKTINKLTEITNRFDRKFLQMHFDISKCNTYYFNDDIIAYQLRGNYLFSSIEIFTNKLVPLHTLSNISNTNKTNIKFDINKFIPTLSLI